MAPPPQEPREPPEQGRVDEANAESFPASDAPSWTAAHLGAPSVHPRVGEHGHELRASLREDVDRLERVTALSETDEVVRRQALEDLVVRALLDAGRAVTRTPLGEAAPARIVEAEVAGASRDHPPLVVAARYDGPHMGGVVLLLALARELASTPLARTTRLLAFPEGGGGPYVERMRAGAPAHAVLCIEDISLARRPHEEGVVLVGNWRARRVLRSVRRGFRTSSRVPVGAMALPSWLPGVAASEFEAFWRTPWPAVLVSDHRPWQTRRQAPLRPDIDRMATAVPGLVSAVARLAGGRV